MVKPTQELINSMGERLKKLRQQYGYTQQQVADYLHIDQSNYSKIEHGKRRLGTIRQVQDLCILYDCTEEYILCESDDYIPQEWSGMMKKMDLNVIAQMNETVRFLRMLRKIEKNLEMKLL